MRRVGVGEVGAELVRQGRRDGVGEAGGWGRVGEAGWGWGR